MNILGSLLSRIGCICPKETVVIRCRSYTALKTLGEGGFSTVLLVEDNEHGNKYAMKKIICHGSEELESANQEINYYNILKHSNIIQSYDTECINISPPGALDEMCEVLILLDYYPNGTLANELARRARTNDYLSTIDILHVFRQICDGVKAFHESPIPLAHRDLKTANILLDDGLKPIIMDLGSVAPARIKVTGSREAQKLQDLAAVRCSMPYRAPELFNVENYCMIDERTDIWSLGCILYAMCYFKSPFEMVHERGDSIALAVMSANLTFPENAPYKEDMQNLILFLLKVNPMERPYIYSVIEKIDDEIAKLENIA